MSDPNSFVNFADWFDLNRGAGDEMRERLEAGYTGPREGQLQNLSDQHVHDAMAAGRGDVGGMAQYERSGDGVRQGVARYSEFLLGMADPAKRQALLEKTYGKGSVSALDSALAGNGLSSGDAKARVNRLQTTTGAKDVMADAQLGETQSAWKAGRQRDAAEQLRRQRSADKTAAANTRQTQDSENARVDSWARKSGRFGYSPGDFRMGQYDPTDSMRGDKTGFDLWRWVGSGAGQNQTNQREAARTALDWYEKSSGKKWDANKDYK